MPVLLKLKKGSATAKILRPVGASTFSAPWPVDQQLRQQMFMGLKVH